MSNEIKLPDLGEGVIEGEILKILVSPGETISLDQPLVEVMTDKASMEIPSSKEGIIKEIKAKVGDRVEVGETIFVLKDSKQETVPKKQPISLHSKPEKQEKTPANSTNLTPQKTDPLKKRHSSSGTSHKKTGRRVGSSLRASLWKGSKGTNYKRGSSSAH